MSRQSLLPHRAPKETFSSAEISLHALENHGLREAHVAPVVRGLGAKLKAGSYTPVAAETAFYPVARAAAADFEARTSGRAKFSHEDVKEAALLLLHACIDDIARAAEEPSP